jgi:hypothetical protein
MVDTTARFSGSLDRVTSVAALVALAALPWVGLVLERPSRRGPA